MSVPSRFGRAALCARRSPSLVGKFDNCGSSALRAARKYRLSRLLDLWQGMCWRTVMTFAALGLAVLLLSSQPASAETTVLPPDCLTPTRTIAPQTIVGE